MSALIAKIFPKGKFANKMLPAMGANEQLKKLSPYMAEYIGLKLAGLVNSGKNLTPGCMLGPVPIYALVNVEAGKSDKQLRFRSIGGQFLAFQEGDNQSLRMDITLSGDARFLYLSILDSLYARGLGTFKVKEFNDMSTGQVGTLGSSYNPATANCVPVVIGAASMEQTVAPQRATLPSTGAATNSAANNPNGFLTDDITINKGEWKKQDGYASAEAGPESNDPWEEVPHWQSRERIIVHKTFPVITEEEIFSRMYIESMFWRKAVGTNGIHDITVNLLMRRYIEPPEKMFILTHEAIREKIRGNQCQQSKLSKGTSPNGTEMLESSSDKATKAKGNLANKLFARIVNSKGKVQKVQIDGSAKVVQNPAGGAPRAYINGKGYSLQYQDEDKQAYYEKNVAAKPEEIANPKNLTKSFEDDYDIAYYKPHGYVASVADTQKPGDYAMLAVNMLWRGMMIGSNMVINGFSAKALTTDPIIGRTVNFSKAITSTGGPGYGVTDAPAPAPVNTGSITRSGTVEYTGESNRDLSLKTALETFGIDLQTGKTFRDVMQIPARQNTFESMILNGCDYKSFQGRIPIKGILSFTTPLQMTWYVYLNTSPYGQNINVSVSLQGYRMMTQPGMLYFLGTPDKPTWITDETNGLIYCNKSPRDEMYLYVQSLDMNNEDVLVYGTVIMPTRGVN
jgi:hypothetical protein